MKVVPNWNPGFNTAPVIGSAINASALTASLTTDYVGNKIYENETLKRTLVDGGYIEGTQYYFYLTDHLGNNRVVAKAEGAVVQRTHFYPFGMEFAEKTGEDSQPYKYNGKELDKELGLEMYDYSARYMDPAIGRFTSIDPLAEKFYSWSPYTYVYNNPLKHTDPDGEVPMLVGALVGGALDYAFQVGINYASGKSGTEAWTDVDMGSIAIFAAAGATGVGLANVVSKGITATKVIQNGSKVVKVAAVMSGDAAVGATVSAGTQLAKTGEVDAKSVVIDAATSGIGGQIGSKVKGAKQNSTQGKQLQRTANRDARVAGTAPGRTPSRSSRINKASKSVEKAESYGNKSVVASSTASSNTGSNAYKEYEDRK